MSAKRHLYDILGLSPSASQAEIARAKRAAMKRTHPDAGGKTEDFIAVGRAVAILSDPLKRAKYDATGDEDLNTVNNEQGEALTLLGAIFEQLVAKYGQQVPYLDMVSEIKKHLRTEIKSAQGDIEQHLGAKRLFVFITKKFKKRKGASPLFGLLFEKRLKDFDQQIEKLRYVIKVRERSLELLEGWSFEVEAQPTTQQQAYSMGLGRVASNFQFGSSSR